jgi:predicted adenylyl cyclase CyaB
MKPSGLRVKSSTPRVAGLEHRNGIAKTEYHEGRGKMAINIEIKAIVNDPGTLKSRAEAISDTPVQVLNQEDTFFYTPRGRLKLRVLGPQDGQLVYYERADTAGPKSSNYHVLETRDPALLKLILTAALGARGVVRKQRLLYMVKNCRVHLDNVQGLGTFMELEIVLSENQSEQEGETFAADLMSKLGIQENDLIDVAYIDLLEQQSRS